jgi:hypothetical protein
MQCCDERVTASSDGQSLSSSTIVTDELTSQGDGPVFEPPGCGCSCDACTGPRAKHCSRRSRGCEY